jgi:hypothetical protein
MILVAGNLALVGAVASGDPADVLTVEFTTLPGGLAATVTNQSNSEVDLVITGIRKKPYPIDERILEPWLERRGITEVNRVFLLTADYDAIDDILRVAADIRCSRLLVPPRLRPSIHDQLNSMVIDSGELNIDYFRDGDVPSGSTGYCWQYGGLCLKTPDSRLLFMDRMKADLMSDSSFAGEDYIAIGQKWAGSANDWMELHDLGYDRIICSEFEQAAGTAYFDPSLEPDDVPPDYCHDLSADGNLVLRLPLFSES